MKENTSLNASLELTRSITFQQASYVELIQGLREEISHYKNALQNADKRIDVYEDEINHLKYENQRLSEKCIDEGNVIKELMKNLIKNEEQKARQLALSGQIQELNKKLGIYQKTIQILQDKLLILNVAIKKQQYSNKISVQCVTDQKFPLNTMFRTPSSKSRTLKSGESQKSSKMAMKSNVKQPTFFKQISNISTQAYDSPIRMQTQQSLDTKYSMFRCKRANTEQATYTTDNETTPRSSKYF